MCHQSTLFKRCRLCGEEKLLSDFRPRSTSRDGVRNECRACHNAYLSASYYANRESRLARRREEWPARREDENTKRRAHRAANSDRIRAVEYAWREANPRPRSPMNSAQIEAARVRARQWYAENTDRAKQNVARHKRLNAEAHRVWQIAYQARKFDAPGSHTKEEWAALCEQYDYCCLACGKQTTLTVDHVIPLSRGGSNDIGNLQPLCRSCNSRKNANVIDYRQQWREEHPDVIAA